MILIIAYGNSLRRDDGAGHVLAKILEQSLRLHHIEVERLSTHQLVPEFAADIAKTNVSTVIFVDTCAVSPYGNQSGVQIEQISASTDSPSVGHHLNPSTLLIYADQLYGKKLSAWQMTIPGIDFEHGEQFSQLTQTALDEVRQLISEWLFELEARSFRLFQENNRPKILMSDE